LNSSQALFESLEPRQLLSVSAKTLTGPTAKGTRATYGVYDNGTLSSSYTNTNEGIVTVGGLSDYEVDSTETSGGTVIVNKQYLHQGSKGLLLYKTFGDEKASNSETKTTTVYSPPESIFPFSLTAKQTVTAGFGFTETNVQTPGGTSGATITGTFSIELASEKTSPLKVPGGKFDVYTLYSSLRSTQNGKVSKSKGTAYYSPDVGLVETMSLGSTEVIELTGFKHAPKAASAIAITASPFADGTDQKSLWSEVGD
jgi:hypothetical protein